MFPTLQEGDYFLVKLNPDDSALRRGDIVLLRNHIDFIELPILTKRILGLPNETIRISNDSVFVDEVFLSESYAYFELGQNAYSRVKKVKIPNGHYFVVGDNRDTSIDSRDVRVGTINGMDITGKVIWIFQHDETDILHKTTNNNTHFVKKDYCGRSMLFGAKKIELLIGAKRYSVVCAHVNHHSFTRK